MKRELTPFVAIVLLLLMAIAIIGFAYVFFYGIINYEEKWECVEWMDNCPEGYIEILSERKCVIYDVDVFPDVIDIPCTKEIWTRVKK